MWRVYLIIALVIGFLVGGLLILRSTAKTRVPPEVIAKARERNAERAARGEKDGDS